MRHMVMMLDGDGLPRAWAISEDLELARAEARRQLDRYVAKNNEMGEPMSAGDFGELVREVE